MLHWEYVNVSLMLPMILTVHTYFVTIHKLSILVTFLALYTNFQKSSAVILACFCKPPRSVTWTYKVAVFMPTNSWISCTPVVLISNGLVHLHTPSVTKQACRACMQLRTSITVNEVGTCLYKAFSLHLGRWCFVASPRISNACIAWQQEVFISRYLIHMP